MPFKCVYNGGWESGGGGGGGLGGLCHLSNVNFMSDNRYCRLNPFKRELNQRNNLGHVKTI